MNNACVHGYRQPRSTTNSIIFSEENRPRPRMVKCARIERLKRTERRERLFPPCLYRIANAIFFCVNDYENMEVDTLKKCFPKVITNLPEADIEFKGVRGWIAQGENHQIVFFEIEPFGEVSEHSHGSPQWGLVAEGRMELTIGNNTKVYEKGDEYFIPAHTKHSARFLSKFRSIDFFGEKMRYKPKVR